MPSVAGAGRLYGRLLAVLAAVAGALMAAITAMIVVDVVMRNLGFQPPAHTLTLTEYGLLYITMLGAPWLLRMKGHVYIELLTTAVAPGIRRLLAIAVYVLCCAACLIIFYYSLQVTIDDFRRASLDVSSFDMPRWLLFAVMPVSFLLMAIEFARYLIGFDNMFSGDAGIHE